MTRITTTKAAIKAIDTLYLERCDCCVDTMGCVTCVTADLINTLEDIVAANEAGGSDE